MPMPLPEVMAKIQKLMGKLDPEEVQILKGAMLDLMQQQVVEAPKPKPANTPKFDALIAASPDLMAELMTDFLVSKEYNARAKTRMKMKIVLDLASVDTKYPDIPALQSGRPGRGQMGMPLGLPGMPGDFMGPPMARGALNNGGQEIEPIPGANPERENEDILDAPGGNVMPPAEPAAPANP